MTTLNTFTFNQCNTCIKIVKNTIHPKTIIPVLAYTISLNSPVIKELVLIKREQDSGQILHDHTKEKSDRHRKKDTQNHGKSLFGIQQIPQLQSA